MLILYISVKNTSLQSNEMFFTSEQTKGTTSLLAFSLSNIHKHMHTYSNTLSINSNDFPVLSLLKLLLIVGRFSDKGTLIIYKYYRIHSERVSEMVLNISNACQTTMNMVSYVTFFFLRYLSLSTTNRTT